MMDVSLTVHRWRVEVCDEPANEHDLPSKGNSKRLGVDGGPERRLCRIRVSAHEPSPFREQERESKRRTSAHRASFARALWPGTSPFGAGAMPGPHRGARAVQAW